MTRPRGPQRGTKRFIQKPAGKSGRPVKVHVGEPIGPVCVHCGRPAVELPGKSLMAGKAPTHKHRDRVSRTDCPKGNPLFEEDVK